MANSTEGSLPAEINQRSADRLNLMIRAAKLIGPSGEFLCIIRDVSETGVRVKALSALPGDEHMELELANGSRFEISRVWHNETEAGFRFDAPIDVPAFVAERGKHPKRAMRLRVECPATISANGETTEAAICDISRQGARIRTSRPLALRQDVTLSAFGIGTLRATVQWRDRPFYGLVLREIFSLEELAKTVAAIHLPQDAGRLKRSSR